MSEFYLEGIGETPAQAKKRKARENEHGKRPEDKPKRRKTRKSWQKRKAKMMASLTKKKRQWRSKSNMK